MSVDRPILWQQKCSIIAQILFWKGWPTKRQLGYWWLVAAAVICYSNWSSCRISLNCMMSNVMNITTVTSWHFLDETTSFLISYDFTIHHQYVRCLLEPMSQWSNSSFTDGIIGSKRSVVSSPGKLCCVSSISSILALWYRWLEAWKMPVLSLPFW